MADGRDLSYGQRAWAQDVGARLKIPDVERVGYLPEVMAPVVPQPKMTAARRGRIETMAKATSKEIAAYRRMMGR